jgi:lipoprotein-anchoring transpeptidase ErfK/SrfK
VKVVVSLMYLAMLLVSSMSWAAKTYLTLGQVDVLDAPNGSLIDTWPDKTLFTSSSESELWVTISGHFPEGVWQPLETELYVQKSEQLKLRTPYQHKSAKTVVYKALKKVGSNAKAYKLLEDALVYINKPKVITAEPLNTSLEVNANYIELSQPVNVPVSLDNKAADTMLWSKDTVFTTSYEDAYLIKVTGHFPVEGWEALEHPLWIKKPVKLQDRTQPRRYERNKSSKRFAIIDKRRFELSVYEVVDGKKEKLMRTPVALGYDRCLPKSKGGKCYYTPEGEFEIEFKLFDPDGINWCIPPKMAGEFKSKLAKGERCWRGVMGNYAMHFGDSLFLHGTSNPNSIGSRTTHGCVRLRNPDIEMVYQMLKNGDKVLISETPEQFDLVALAEEQTEPLIDDSEALLETKPVL